MTTTDKSSSHTLNRQNLKWNEAFKSTMSNSDVPGQPVIELKPIVAFVWWFGFGRLSKPLFQVGLKGRIGNLKSNFIGFPNLK